jgi:SAM-dependent methyltransferase/uncharacterized protein YbaR (Trm112 family)
MFIIYKYGQKLKAIQIERNGVVLDIGSGHNPFIRADVLCDKYVDTHKHRSSKGLLKRNGRPLIIGDACNLPFKDSSFDFVICRHVLEHVEDPEALLRELKRVGKKGYIETPSPFSELIHGGILNQKDIARTKGIEGLIHGIGHEGHLRFVVSEGKKIITCEKTEDELAIYLIFGYYIKNNTDYKIEKFRRKHASWYFTTHVWDDSTSLEFKTIKINSDKTIKTTEHYDVDQQINILKQLISKNKANLNGKIKEFIRKCFYSSTKSFDIYEKIACPICKSGLIKESDSLLCENCDCEFPVVSGVPILIKEAINKKFR